MKNVITMMIACAALVFTPVVPAHASVIDPPRIEAKVVNTTPNWQMVDLICVNADGLDAIDFEVELTDGATITNSTPFWGRLITKQAWSSPEEMVSVFKWVRTSSTQHREPLTTLYISNSGTVASATMAVHVTRCVVDNREVCVEDVKHEIVFPISPEQRQEPMIEIVNAIDSDLCVRTNANMESDGATIVVAVYGETGRMICTLLKPVSEMPVDGKGYRIWATRNSIPKGGKIRAILVDRNFCPLCEPDEAIVRE